MLILPKRGLHDERRADATPQQERVERGRVETAKSQTSYQVLEFELALCEVAIERQTKIVLVCEDTAQGSSSLLGVVRQRNKRFERFRRLELRQPLAQRFQTQFGHGDASQIVNEHPFSAYLFAEAQQGLDAR
jgi:hypothetical protein